MVLATGWVNQSIDQLATFAPVAQAEGGLQTCQPLILNLLGKNRRLCLEIKTLPIYKILVQLTSISVLDFCGFCVLPATWLIDITSVCTYIIGMFTCAVFRSKKNVLEIRPLSRISGREIILRDIPGKTGIVGMQVYAFVLNQLQLRITVICQSILHCTACE